METTLSEKTKLVEQYAKGHLANVGDARERGRARCAGCGGGSARSFGDSRATKLQRVISGVTAMQSAGSPKTRS
jgi:hypothetical protein